MFKISTEQVNAILAYLSKRPYGEVFQIVGLLRSLETIEKPKTDKPKKLDPVHK